MFIKGDFPKVTKLGSSGVRIWITVFLTSMLGNLTSSSNLTLIFLITILVGNWPLETVLDSVLIKKKNTLTPWFSKFAIHWISWGAQKKKKIVMPGSHPRRFWFNWYTVQPGHWNFKRLPRWLSNMASFEN